MHQEDFMDYSKAIKELNLMQQAYATFFTVTNKLQTLGDSYFDGLTARQYMVMLAIAHLPEDETTLVNIAKKLGTTKQSANQLLANLESKGYLTAISSKLDKRAKNMKITESGKNVMLEYSEKGIEFFADIFNDFTCEELETLWCLLQKLYQFDGEEQSGFEEDVNDKFADLAGLQEAQMRALEKFALRRSHSSDHNSGKEHTSKNELKGRD